MPPSSPPLPPTRPDFIPFTTPYFCAATPYDHKPAAFHDFPTRQGWHLHIEPGKPDTRQYNRLDGSDASQLLVEKVAFLQAWLFFGLLTETSALYGLDLDVEAEFLTDNGTVVSTEALNGLSARWLWAAEQHEDWRARHSRVLELCEYVNDRMFGPHHWGDKGRRCTFEECRALLAVEMLFRAVILTLSRSGGYGEEILGPLLATKRFDYQLALWTRANRARYNLGMCDSERKMLVALGREMPYLFFLTRMKRTRMGHDNCTEFRCMADQIDEATYKTIHVDEDCQCGFVEANVQQVCDFLERGEIPVIAVDDDLKITVVNGDNYVAISHVWSHGIGNPTSNAIPLCQLRRIRNSISKLDVSNPDLHLFSPTTNTYAFWMDTLCIPVAPNLKPYRKKAITLMGNTYLSATAVLVLDRDLKDITSSSTSLLEQSLWLLFSGWLRRLWTLQEAALARTLFLEFRDGPAPYTRPENPSTLIANKLKRDRLASDPDPENNLIPDILLTREIDLLIQRRIPLARHIRVSSTDPDHPTPYQYLAAATESRCTSKLKDEPLILATIMGHDNIAAMLEEPDDTKRMGMWHVAMRSIPADIIFLDTQIVKMAHAPFRWAPVSLMENELARQTTDFPGVCDEEGLHVKFAAFMLADGQECGAEKIDVRWYLRDQQSGTVHKVSHNMTRKLPTEKCAILFNLEQHRYGAVAEILGERRKGSEVEYVVHVVGLVAFFKKLGMPPEKKMKPGRDLLVCTRTGPEQKWCVT